MGSPSANWEVGLTLAEVVRDQKGILRTSYFLSPELFLGTLPSGQEALFILLTDADIHYYIACGILTIMENLQQAGMAPWRLYKVGSWSQTSSFSESVT